METQQIVVDRKEARDLYRKYREHQHYAEPIDHEIQRTYQLIAQGRIVIKALDSIISAGVGVDGYPKLAIIRADAERCFCSYRHGDEGTIVRFAAEQWTNVNHHRKYIDIRFNGFLEPPKLHRNWARVEAMVPLIPIHLRPKRGLENYHILFEAVWRPAPPVDPMLLRRIGKADLWLVCAAWDLSSVEQAVLAGRLNG